MPAGGSRLLHQKQTLAAAPPASYSFVPDIARHQDERRDQHQCRPVLVANEGSEGQVDAAGTSEIAQNNFKSGLIIGWQRVIMPHLTEKHLNTIQVFYVNLNKNV